MKAYMVTSISDIFDESYCEIVFGDDMKHVKHDAWSLYSAYEGEYFTDLRYRRYPDCDGMEKEPRWFAYFVAVKNGDMWFEGLSSDEAETMTFEEFLMAMDVSKERIKQYVEIFNQKYAERLQKKLNAKPASNHSAQ